VEIVSRGTWHVCKLLASVSSLGEVEGVNPECRPIVTDAHHFGVKGVSPGVKVADAFMKFSHDIVCLLAVQAL